MHFSSSILSLAVVASSLLTSQATPLRPRNDGADAIARSMMGPSSNIVSWDSLPLERSPSDPDFEDLTARGLEKRIVYNPPVTYPAKGTVWTAGQHETVKWTVDQNKIPAEAKNYKATLKLGYMPADGSGGLNLKWTLAKDFPITEESMGFKLPADLETRSDYIIVLMGDSGNRSKKFTINAKKPATKTQTVKPVQNKAAVQAAPSPARAAPATNNDASDDIEEQLAANIVDEVRSDMLGRDVMA